MKSILAACCAIILLAACTSISDPVSVGKDTYMISAGAHGGFSSNNELETETLQKAGAFCTAQGKNIDVQTTGSSGLQGWTPQQSKVIFRCLSDDDPAYKHNHLVPEPNLIIENRNR